MTIGQDLFTVLSGVGAQDVSPNIAPDQVARPNIVFAVVHEQAQYTLAGRSNLTPAHYQVDVYDRTYAGAQALADAVQVAMDAARSVTFGCTQLGRLDAYEPEGKLHRVILDFSIWHL
jgi:hypothetical protein